MAIFEQRFSPIAVIVNFIDGEGEGSLQHPPKTEQEYRDQRDYLRRTASAAEWTWLKGQRPKEPVERYEIADHANGGQAAQFASTKGPERA